jgi:bifunctional non-homologous end joining protein LigD
VPRITQPKPLLADAKPLRTNVRRRRDPEQPGLLLDPMPERIEPCLALLKSKPPIGPEWSWEVKWDGYRLAVHIEPRGVRIVTRGGHDWTHRFPAIAAAAWKLPVATAILDGEAVVFDENGRPDFGLLQNSLGGRGGKRPSGESVFMAFDLLYFDGSDLTKDDYSSRRHKLDQLVPHGQSGTIRLSEEIDADPTELLGQSCALGLEGIVGKRLDRPYRSGRLGDWIKVKCIQSDSFVIIGYERSAVAYGGVGRLLLAARKGDELVYVGGVGTGFNQRTATALRKQMDKLKIAKPAVETGRKEKDAVYIEPVLVAEIEYRAWTHEGMLRHASYKGLRDEADNAAVYRLPD